MNAIARDPKKAVFIPKPERYEPDCINQVIRQLRELDAMIADRSFLLEYRARSMVLGKPVLVYSGDEPEEAVAEDIDEQGALLVRRADGSLRRLSTGEISIRVKAEKDN